MPQVIAAAVAYLIPATAATAVTVAATAVSYATLIGYAATIGASIAYGSAQSAKMRNALASLSSDQGRNVMSRDPLASRRGVYGQVPLSGPILFMHTTGAKNEFLHVVVGLAGHQCEELGNITFPNDEAVPLDGSGNATGKYAGFFTVKKHLGSTTQTYDTDLAAATGLWTSAHRLRGIAYLYLKFKYSADLFPNGMPIVKCLVKGKKLYDPREVTHDPNDPTTWAWSDNSALCTADYLNDKAFGRGIPWSRIVTAEVAAEANICDELKTLADASTEKQFTCNGTFNADQDALPDIVGSMAGRVIETGGIWSIAAGAYRTVTAPTFTDDDLLGAFSVQTRSSMRDTFNGVKGTFFSPENQWTPSDFPAVTGKLAATAVASGDKVTILTVGTTDFTLIGAANNSVGTTFTATGAGTGTGYVDPYQGQDNGNRKWKDIALPFTTSPSAAQRISKIDLKRGRQQIVITALYKLKAFQLRCCDTIKITRAVLGWTDKQFEVMDWALQVIMEGDNLCLGILITAKETASTVYDWNNGEETTVDDALNTTLPDPSVVPTPVVTLLTDSTTVIVQPDGTVQPRIKATWLTANNIFVEEGGKAEIEYKLSTDADSQYRLWLEVRGDMLQEYITDVKVGLQYYIRIRWRNQLGVRGAYSTPVLSSAVAGDPNAPAAGTNFTAVAKPGYVLLDWDPSVTNSVNEYVVERSTVSAIAGFAAIAQTPNSQYEDPDVVAGTTYWYRVKARTRSEQDSSYFAPASSVVALNAAVGAAVPGAAGTVTDNGGDDTYDATDGSVFAIKSVDVPGLPTNALWQNVLMRVTGSDQWEIVAQLKNASADLKDLDDLSPGVSYDVALQAWSAAGASAVTAGFTFTAATKTDPPDTIVSGACTKDSSAPAVKSDLSAVLFGSRVSWTPPSNKDIAYYEVKVVSTNNPLSTVYTWYDFEDSTFSGVVKVPYGKTSVMMYSASLGGGAFAFVRAVNTSGVGAVWFNVGQCNAVGSAVQALGTAALRNIGTGGGTAAAGDDSRFTNSRQCNNSFDSASTARTNLGVRTGDHVPTLSGGAPTEQTTHNHAIGTAQNHVLVQVVATSGFALNNIAATFDFAAGGNDANNCVIFVYTLDGTNLPNQAIRFLIHYLP